MVSPLAVGTAATEVTCQPDAGGERTYEPINRRCHASSTFTAGREGEATPTLDEQGVHVRGPVRHHLVFAGSASDDEDIPTREREHSPLKTVMAEQPELLSAKRHPKDRLVWPLD